MAQNFTHEISIQLVANVESFIVLSAELTKSRWS